MKIPLRAIWENGKRIVVEELFLPALRCYVRTCKDFYTYMVLERFENLILVYELGTFHLLIREKQKTFNLLNLT